MVCLGSESRRGELGDKLMSGKGRDQITCYSFNTISQRTSAIIRFSLRS